MMGQTEDPNEFLMGGGVPAAKFPKVGATVVGKVLRLEQSQQRDFKTSAPLYWDDNQPRMQLVVTLQTEEREDPSDDGIRKLYVKGRMLAAVRNAVRAAKASGLEKGGTLAVKFYDTEDTKAGEAKLYTAQYKSPEAFADLAGVSNTADRAGAEAPAATDLI